jgi:hypothetical protein
LLISGLESDVSEDAKVCAICRLPKTLVDLHLVPRFFLRAPTSEILAGKVGKPQTSPEWLKIKVRLQQEFVIGGFSQGKEA